MCSSINLYLYSGYIIIFFILTQFHAVAPCSDTFNTTSGTLYSVNYPGNYNNDMNCTTVIEINEAFYIEILFEKLHTESLADLNLIGDLCNLDYVEIKVNGEHHRICGNWEKKEHLLYFRFQTDRVEVVLVSDELTTQSGYIIRWDASLYGGYSSVTCAVTHIDTTDSCYELVAESMRWEDGQQYCKSKGANLAKIDSLETDTAIQKELLSRKPETEVFWIGASDRLYEGDFLWPDRSAVSFKNWFPGWSQLNTTTSKQPSDDGLSNEDCVEMRRQFPYSEKGSGLASSYFWNDRDCSAKNPFICQYFKHREKSLETYIPEDCNTFINLTSERPTVTVASPMHPQNYPELTSCHIIVVAPLGKQPVVDFIFFKLEGGLRCEFDNVTIASLHRSKEVTFCDDWTEKLKNLRWTSDDNTMIISFITDHSKNYPGFKATIGYSDLADVCSSYKKNDTSSSWQYGPGGCWKYSNYSTDYATASSVCEEMGGEIPDTFNNKTLAQFAFRLLQYTDQIIQQCISLWLGSIKEELWKPNITNATACPSVILCSETARGKVYLEVKPTLIYSPCSTHLESFCIQPLPVTKVEHHKTILTKPSGSIHSQGYPDLSYPNSYHHVYEFVSPSNHHVYFTIHHLDLEYQQNCLYDSVRIYGTTNDKLLCGNTSEENFMSVSNKSSIHFVTDDDVSAAGFNLSWYWINAILPFQYSGTTANGGTVSSLNFPKSFPQATSGCATLAAPDGQRVLIEFKTINLPELNCNNSMIELYSGSELLKVFCGNDTLSNMQYFDWIVLSLNGLLDVCLFLPELKENEGLSATYRFVPTDNAELENTVWLMPNSTSIITNLMYPSYTPRSVSHHVSVETPIGYTVALNSIEVDVHGSTNCTDNYLEIIDQSLTNENTNVLGRYTCSTKDKNKIIELGIKEIKTYLNVMKLRLNSMNTSRQTIRFKAKVSSSIDEFYRNKTIHDSGSFKRCDASTCGEFGKCESTGHDRYRCACHPHYTGLFCQITKCGLNPCFHGNCSLTPTGFECNCTDGYWGARCNMDDFVCQFRTCSGHGQCVKGQDTVNTTCACNTGWTGSRCDTAIPEAEDQLTIGQKLLKEPIWIGMIVILNLVFFFCVSYVARRKCGKRISRLMPKRKKPTALPTPNEFCYGREESSTNPRNIYSLQIEIPRSEASSKSPTAKTPTKFLFERVGASTPSTPTVRDGAISKAALRFFESYNVNKSLFPPQVDTRRRSSTTGISPLVQNGTLSFMNDDSSSQKKEDNSPPMLRSYTIGSLDRDISETKKKRRRSLRYSHSLPCTPKLEHKLKQKAEPNTSEGTLQVPTKTGHCYPEIKILNEYNHEQPANSDSENSENMPTQLVSRVKPKKDINASYMKSVDSADSGYPTTSLSSQHTQPSGVCRVRDKRTSNAEEKRKMFGNKNKGSSFYDISSSKSNLSIENCSISSDIEHQRRTLELSRNALTDYNSFESDNYCLMCQRDRRLGQAHTYSCESELDNLHKRDSRFSGSRSRPKCYCKRCRHRRKSHFRKHIRQFSREIDDLDISYRNRNNSSRRVCQEMRKHASDRCNFTSTSYRSFRDYSNEKHSTSTESDACDHSRRNVRSRRKCYKRIEHNSDDSRPSRFKMPHISTIQTNARSSWELCQERAYKREMVDSYLSTVDYLEFPFPETYQSLSKGHSAPSVCGSHHSRHTSFGSSCKSISSPMLERLSKCRQLPHNGSLPDVEMVSRNDNDKVAAKSKSLDKLYNTPTSSSESSDKTHNSNKDSAYQTKQSSVDRYNSIKENNNSTKSRNRWKQDDNSNRNEDKVRRHLYQAAQKLAMIKHFHTNLEQSSRDSAICTFSEEDISEPESNRASVKRASGGLLAFQMKEMNLSEVKEECSGFLNTPNNEPCSESLEKQRDELKTVIPLKTLCAMESNRSISDSISYLDETKV